MDDRFRFRAFSKKLNRIVDVVSIHWTHKQIMWFDGKIFIIEPFDEIILMQCTGLRDKTGKLIYEGDVVRHYGDWGMEYKSVVQYSDGFYSPLVHAEEGHGDSLEGYEPAYYKIIGNIYENPEILRP